MDLPNKLNPSTGLPDQWTPLTKLHSIFAQLNKQSVSLCHWKSNYHIQYALTGIEDIDVLIKAEDFANFVQILLQHDFKAADSTTSRQQPGVFHFLGNDDATGTLINFHAYTRILTGDHFLKSWALPFEVLLLEETTPVQGLPLTAKSTELIVFVIRNMIKHTVLVDFLMICRSGGLVSEELEWLQTDSSLDDSLEKLDRYFPEVDPADFQQALTLLNQPGHLMAKVRCGFRFKKALGKYRRYPGFKQTYLTLIAIFKMAVNKFGRKQKHMQFHTGGKIIALIGPQATGKSTLIAAIQAWLGQELYVHAIHVGKPPSTGLSWLPNQFIPWARTLFPGQTTIKIEKQAQETDTHTFPIIFMIRKLISAHERKRLLKSAYQHSRNGQMVICDRYPSDIVGAIDGATFTDADIEAQTSMLKRFLMKQERRLYQHMCPPDLVIQLTVSADVAVARNQTREKTGKQSTEYVRLRHAMNRTPEFKHCPVIQLSTDEDLETTVINVKQHVWRYL